MKKLLYDIKNYLTNEVTEAIAQDKGKLRTTDAECSISYKKKKNKPLI